MTVTFGKTVREATASLLGETATSAFNSTLLTAGIVVAAFMLLVMFIYPASGVTGKAILKLLVYAFATATVVLFIHDSSIKIAYERKYMPTAVGGFQSYTPNVHAVETPSEAESDDDSDDESPAAVDAITSTVIGSDTARPPNVDYVRAPAPFGAANAPFGASSMSPLAPVPPRMVQHPINPIRAQANGGASTRSTYRPPSGLRD